jgi:hypothetical protein
MTHQNLRDTADNQEVVNRCVRVVADRRIRVIGAGGAVAATHVAISVTSRISRSLRRVRVARHSTSAATCIGRLLCRVCATIRAAVLIGSHLLRVSAVAAHITISANVRIRSYGPPEGRAAWRSASSDP